MANNPDTILEVGALIDLSQILPGLQELVSAAQTATAQVSASLASVETEGTGGLGAGIDALNRSFLDLKQQQGQLQGELRATQAVMRDAGGSAGVGASLFERLRQEEISLATVDRLLISTKEQLRAAIAAAAEGQLKEFGEGLAARTAAAVPVVSVPAAAQGAAYDEEAAALQALEDAKTRQIAKNEELTIAEREYAAALRQTANAQEDVGIRTYALGRGGSEAQIELREKALGLAREQQVAANEALATSETRLNSIRAESITEDAAIAEAETRLATLKQQAVIVPAVVPAANLATGPASTEAAATAQESAAASQAAQSLAQQSAEQVKVAATAAQTTTEINAVTAAAIREAQSFITGNAEISTLSAKVIDLQASQRELNSSLTTLSKSELSADQIATKFAETRAAQRLVSAQLKTAEDDLSEAMQRAYTTQAAAAQSAEAAMAAATRQRISIANQAVETLAAETLGIDQNSASAQRGVISTDRLAVANRALQDALRGQQAILTSVGDAILVTAEENDALTAAEERVVEARAQVNAIGGDAVAIEQSVQAARTRTSESTNATTQSTLGLNREIEKLAVQYSVAGQEIEAQAALLLAEGKSAEEVQTKLVSLGYGAQASAKALKEVGTAAGLSAESTTALATAMTVAEPAMTRVAAATVAHAQAQTNLRVALDAAKNAAAGDSQAVNGLAIAQQEAAATARELAAAVSEAGSAMSGTGARTAEARVELGALTGSVGATEFGLARLAGMSATLGPILEAAFPILLIVSFAEIIGTVIEKVSKYGDALRKAAIESDALAISAIHQADSIELQNLKLDDQLAKLEGRPTTNRAKEAALEAKLSVDQLTSSMQKTVEKEIELESYDPWTNIANLATAAAEGVGHLNAELTSVYIQVGAVRQLKESLSGVARNIEDAQFAAAQAKEGSEAWTKAIKFEIVSHEELAKAYKQELDSATLNEDQRRNAIAQYVAQTYAVKGLNLELERIAKANKLPDSQAPDIVAQYREALNEIKSTSDSFSAVSAATDAAYWQSIIEHAQLNAKQRLEVQNALSAALHASAVDAFKSQIDLDKAYVSATKEGSAERLAAELNAARDVTAAVKKSVDDRIAEVNRLANARQISAVQEEAILKSLTSVDVSRSTEVIAANRTVLDEEIKGHKAAADSLLSEMREELAATGSNAADRIAIVRDTLAKIKQLEENAASGKTPQGTPEPTLTLGGTAAEDTQRQTLAQQTAANEDKRIAIEIFTSFAEAYRAQTAELITQVTKQEAIQFDSIARTGKLQEKVSQEYTKATADIIADTFARASREEEASSKSAEVQIRNNERLFSLRAISFNQEIELNRKLLDEEESTSAVRAEKQINLVKLEQQNLQATLTANARKEASELEVTAAIEAQGKSVEQQTAIWLAEGAAVDEINKKTTEAITKYNEDSEKRIEEIQHKLLETIQQIDNKRIELADQVADHEIQMAERAASIIGSSFTSAFNRMTTTHTSFLATLTKFWNNIVIGFEQMGIKIVAGWVEHLGQMVIQTILQTAVMQRILSALGAGGGGASNAKQAALVSGKIQLDAASAGADVFAQAIAEIPFPANLTAAPALAASTVAQVEAFQGLAAGGAAISAAGSAGGLGGNVEGSAAGGMMVGADQHVFVHQGEMIVPKDITQGLLPVIGAKGSHGGYAQEEPEGATPQTLPAPIATGLKNLVAQSGNQKISFAERGMDVTHDTVAMLHTNEAVLPAPIANLYRDTAPVALNALANASHPFSEEALKSFAASPGALGGTTASGAAGEPGIGGVGGAGGVGIGGEGGAGFAEALAKSSETGGFAAPSALTQNFGAPGAPSSVTNDNRVTHIRPEITFNHSELSPGMTHDDIVNVVRKAVRRGSLL